MAFMSTFFRTSLLYAPIPVGDNYLRTLWVLHVFSAALVVSRLSLLESHTLTSLTQVSNPERKPHRPWFIVERPFIRKGTDMETCWWASASHHHNWCLWRCSHLRSDEPEAQQQHGSNLVALSVTRYWFGSLPNRMMICVRLVWPADRSIFIFGFL